MLDGAYNHSGTASSLGNFEPSLTRQHFFHKLIRHVYEEKASRAFCESLGSSLKGSHKSQVTKVKLLIDIFEILLKECQVLLSSHTVISKKL